MSRGLFAAHTRIVVSRIVARLHRQRYKNALLLIGGVGGLGIDDILLSAVSSPKNLAETIEAAVVDFDLAAGDDTGFDAQQCDEIRKLLNLEAKDPFNVILETFNDFIKTSAEADNERARVKSELAKFVKENDKSKQQYVKAELELKQQIKDLAAQLEAMKLKLASTSSKKRKLPKAALKAAAATAAAPKLPEETKKKKNECSECKCSLLQHNLCLTRVRCVFVDRLIYICRLKLILIARAFKHNNRRHVFQSDGRQRRFRPGRHRPQRADIVPVRWRPSPVQRHKPCSHVR